MPEKHPTSRSSVSSSRKLPGVVPHLLPENRAADLLGVQPSTLERWRYAGKGPRYVKVGAFVRYTPEALLAYIDANTIVPPEAA